MLLRLPEITGLLEGQFTGPNAEVTATGVSTDSRELAPGDLFFALSGERHDGHDFVAAALSAGAAAAVVARRPADLPADAPLIIVPDTLRAYGRLARWWRDKSSARVLAVTGSAGKTTTKNLVGNILARHGPTVVATGTENNEVGVPRTLLRLGPEHGYCVLEFGMRGRGEIAYLAEVARPEIGVITNIGASHLGRLGGREAIAQAKAELLTALPPEGRAVLNADDFFFPLLSEMAPCPVVSFGLGPRAEVRAEDLVSWGLEGSEFALCVGGQRLPVRLPLPGKHHVLNALAAAAAAWAATGSLEGIREGLAQAEVEPMRGEILRLPGPLTVINDAYNASPTSVVAALDLLGSLSGRKVLVLGDMLELGEFAEAEHRAVGALAAQRGVSWLITVGPAAAFAGEAAREAGVTTVAAETPAEAVEILQRGVQPGDIVLVKASRRMALEQVVEGLRHADAL